MYLLFSFCKMPQKKRQTRAAAAMRVCGHTAEKSKYQLLSQPDILWDCRGPLLLKSISDKDFAQWGCIRQRLSTQLNRNCCIITSQASEMSTDIDNGKRQVDSYLELDFFFELLEKLGLLLSFSKYKCPQFIMNSKGSYYW